MFAPVVDNLPNCLCGWIRPAVGQHDRRIAGFEAGGVKMPDRRGRHEVRPMLVFGFPIVTARLIMHVPPTMRCHSLENKLAVAATQAWQTEERLRGEESPCLERSRSEGQLITDVIAR